MANYPSIFNDVIGPVMRGPSSSHCAAALRIGRICRDLMNGKIERVNIKFDPNGSLATTHKSQGSDMGLFGGFLGWETTDERLPDYENAIKESGIKINIEITDIGATHPNTYQLELINDTERREVIAISVGGGMFEIIEIDGSKVSIIGDYFETLIYLKSFDKVVEMLNDSFEFEELIKHNGRIKFIEIKSMHLPPQELIDRINKFADVLCVKKITPVLPILSRKNLQVPYITCEEMLSFNKNRDLKLWELALEYESQRGNVAKEEVFEKMRKIVGIMYASVTEGIKGTEYEDRILDCQSVNFKNEMDNNKLLGGDLINRIILYVTAIMEVKSAMGVIVAAPTAGSCGALPGAVLGVANGMNLSEDETVKALLSAGMIGIFISAHSTFAAEEGGCMAECGSGSGMAAAAIVEMAGGTLKQSISAASVALQNSFGMVCDPIANRVEAPCLGKNIMAATNALSCANMALSNYDHLIPLDEVIFAMNDVAKSMPHSLRCTALGGLSITKTSKEIEKKLEK